MDSPAATSSLLILRTVSVEKLEGVLRASRERWPDATLTVLSNPGRKAELEADARIDEVITVDLGAAGFSHRLQLDRAFTAIVIPVGNRNGAGFANVMRAAAGLRAKSWFLASYARELRPVSRRRLRAKIAWESLVLAACLPLGWLRSRLHRW